MAVPDNGYVFTGWSGDITGTSDQITVDMNGARHVIANFSAIDTLPPILNITAPKNGESVTVDSVFLTGNVSDGGQGNSGVSSVTVNGLGVTGGAAVGGNVADWSFS
ncbi:MAG: InlB B-repeat-containing protein [Gammaproteobacteria bacterium]